MLPNQSHKQLDVLTYTQDTRGGCFHKTSTRYSFRSYLNHRIKLTSAPTPLILCVHTGAHISNPTGLDGKKSQKKAETWSKPSIGSLYLFNKLPKIEKDIEIPEIKLAEQDNPCYKVRRALKTNFLLLGPSDHQICGLDNPSSCRSRPTNALHLKDLELFANRR